MKTVPAEMFIDRITVDCHYKYIWSICQPDACWGVHCSGREDTKEAAFAAAKMNLAITHRKQGIV